jgi:hypothetical protein
MLVHIIVVLDKVRMNELEMWREEIIRDYNIILRSYLLVKAHCVSFRKFFQNYLHQVIFQRFLRDFVHCIALSFEEFDVGFHSFDGLNPEEIDC